MALGYAWTQTRDDIIKRALRQIGVLGIGETPETEAVTNGAQALNAILKQFSGYHTAPWRIVRSAITTTAAQDYVLAGSAGCIGVLEAKISKTSDRNLVSTLRMVNHSEYLEFKNQTTETGEPEIGWASLEGTTSIARIYLYPIPETTYYMDVELLRLMADFGASGDNMEMSAGWANALTYQLAADLSDEYSCPMNERQRLEIKADKALKDAKLTTIEIQTCEVRRGNY